MKVTCPKCRTEIPLEDINVAKDIALCRQCSQTYSFAELSQDSGVADVDTSRPPKGAWYKSQGIESEVGARTRSWAALFLAPFALVWSGLSLGGIYGSQAAKGRFDLRMSLFGIPFVIGTLILVPITLMTVFGKVVVRSSGDQGCVFTGVGPFGWSRRFRWGEIGAVRSTTTRWQQNGRFMPLIELEGPKPIRFGSQLSEARRQFMLAVLRPMAKGRSAPSLY
ncbi:MAG: hypothetical protein ACLQM8_15595 [Limisphaerales bacterium]